MNRQQRFRRSAVAAAIAGLALSGPALAASDGCPGAHDEIVAAEAEVFAEADANGDGKLTPDELATFHDLMRQKLEARRFSRLDTDRDGALTSDELAAGRPRGPHGFPPF